MDKQRIRMSDIVIGQPLPWNVFDAGNKLLLRKGFIVVTEGQIDKLIEQGLFVEGHTKREAEEPPPKENPSALRHVNRAARHLEKLFLNLSNEGDAAAQFREIAREIAQGLHVNADVCVASILLNQGSASLPVRHSVNVAILSCLVARAMGRPDEEIEAIVAAALTMNLGLIPHQKRLLRIPGNLGQEDALIIRNHPLRSVEILKQIGVEDAAWLACVAGHHESEDGSGYPAKSAGADIPLGAKILSTVERYCIRVSAGEPAGLLAHNAAFRDMLAKEKTHVDAKVAGALFKELGTYPVGSFVRLEGGEVAIVSGKGDAPATPVVHELVGRGNAPRTFPIQRNTVLKAYHIQEMIRMDQVNFRFSMQQVWGDDAAA
ncbi:MAG TPA: HD domain-containing phosphohydrolase [Burkholderiaceae bacterium]